MPAPGESRLEPRSKTDGEKLWNTKVDSIPSVFGRLFYVAGLRNREGQYGEPGLESRVSLAVADQIIRESHMFWFRAWLSMGIQEKAEDLKPYAGSLIGLTTRPGAGWGKAWVDLFRDLIPSDASVKEIKHFLNTVSIVQKLLDRS